MKKPISFLLVLLMLLFAVSCNEIETPEETSTPSIAPTTIEEELPDSTAPTVSPEATPTPTPTPEDNKTYTLTFNVNGKKTEYKDLKKGDAITAPTPSNKDRIYFWNKDVPAKMPDSDLSFTATGIGGSLSDSTIWQFDFKSKLTISGKGATPGFSEENQPWAEYKSKITGLSIENGITAIGRYMFFGLENVQNVVIPDSVTTVGSFSFCNCINITSLTIGSKVTNIGQAAFSSSFNLMQITFKGAKAWYVKNGNYTNTVTMSGDAYSNAMEAQQYLSFIWSSNPNSWPSI